MHVEAIVPQVARQPELVPTSLVGNADSGDRAADLFFSLIVPAVQLRQQLDLIDRQLFHRPAILTGQHRMGQQAGMAHFHNHDELWNVMQQ